MAKRKKPVVAESTYLVVIDPWGSYGHPSFINNVAAWFEIMISEEYRDVRVEVVYTQKSQHTNVIVEFSTIFDPRPFIGTHFHSKFLSPPFNENCKSSISFIYEYNFTRFLEPGPRGWAANIPTYNSLPNNFPIQSPYPSPSLPPRPSVPYALCPQNFVTEIPVPEPDFPLQPEIVKEEDNAPSSLALIKKEEEDSRGTLEEANLFLNSITIKKEESRDFLSLPQPARHGYEPSEDLIDAVASLPQNYLDHPLHNKSHNSIVKQEPLDDFRPLADLSQDYAARVPQSIVKMDQLDDGGTYEPSADLVAAVASLPGDYLNAEAPRISHRQNLKLEKPPIKKEPVDEGIRIKKEQSDEAILLQPSHRHQRTNSQGVGASATPGRIQQKTRDPRLARRDLPIRGTSRNFETLGRENEGTDGPVKRIKLEPS